MSASKKIQQLNKQFSEDLIMGLVISDGEQILYQDNENYPFKAASTIKLAIYLYYLQQLQVGKIDLQKSIRYSKDEIVAGAGILQLFPEKREWQIAELLQVMIAVSDNTATNRLMDEAGLPNIQQWLRSYPDAKLERLMMQTSEKENLLTAKAAHQLLVAIFQLSGKLDTQLLNPFLQQQFREGLPGLLDEEEISGLTIYNKTGRLRRIEHDVAAMHYQGNTIFIAAFSEDVQGNGRGISWLRQVGKLAFEEFL